MQIAEKVQTKLLQSLIGLLNFAYKTVAPGRAFCRRLIDATIGIKKPHHFIRVNRGMREDLAVWQQFLDQYNGVTVISSVMWTSDYSLHWFTDRAGGPLGVPDILLQPLGSWQVASTLGFV